MSNLSNFLSQASSKSQSFASSGTWTPPIGVTSASVVVVGGGGSAGFNYASNGATAYAGSGGGGCVSVGHFPISGNVSITVGAGGICTYNTVSHQGQAGGTSSFGTFLNAYGGGGGGNGGNTYTYGGGGGGGGGLAGAGQNGFQHVSNGSFSGYGGGWLNSSVVSVFQGGPSLGDTPPSQAIAGRWATYWIGGGGGGSYSSAYAGPGYTGLYSMYIGGGSYGNPATALNGAAGIGGGGYGYRNSTTPNVNNHGGNGIVIVMWKGK